MQLQLGRAIVRSANDRPAHYHRPTMGKKQKEKARRRELEASLAGDPGALAARLVADALRLTRQTDRGGSTGRVGHVRMSALSQLVANGPTPLTRLASLEAITPPSMTRLVHALERDGLAVRERSSADGRVVLIRATAEGHAAVRAWQDPGTTVIVSRLAELPSSDRAALVRAAEILERILPGEPGGTTVTTR